MGTAAVMTSEDDSVSVAVVPRIYDPAHRLGQHRSQQRAAPSNLPTEPGKFSDLRDAAGATTAVFATTIFAAAGLKAQPAWLGLHP
jgi:hypothetical protein